MRGIHNSCGLCSIEMKNITVISGEDTLLDDVNLTFHCGELTALIGKNGAGKTNTAPFFCWEFMNFFRLVTAFRCQNDAVRLK